MKYYPLLFALLLSGYSQAQGCKVETSKDKFTGLTHKTTQKETVANANYQKWELQVRAADTTVMLGLDFTRSFKVFSVLDNAQLMLLTDKDSVITLQVNKGKVAESIGGGHAYIAGLLFPLTKEQQSALLKSNVKSMRLTLREGYAEMEMSEKKRRVIPALLTCIK